MHQSKRWSITGSNAPFSRTVAISRITLFLTSRKLTFRENIPAVICNKTHTYTSGRYTGALINYYERLIRQREKERDSRGWPIHTLKFYVRAGIKNIFDFSASGRFIRPRCGKGGYICIYIPFLFFLISPVPEFIRQHRRTEKRECPMRNHNAYRTQIVRH